MKSILSYIDPDLLPYPELCRKIEAGENFTLSRFGDGEFYAILGYEGKNCDGNDYTPGLSGWLLHVLRERPNTNPDYYLGLHQALKDEKLCAGTIGVIRALELPDFIPNAIFHDPLKGKGGNIETLFNALRQRDTVIIGPAHLRPAVDLIGAIHFFEIPPQNCLDNYGEIMDELSGYDFTGKVALFCAGPAAPIFVHGMWNVYGNSGTFIDFGSTFDPFCGVNSRSYHAKIGTL